MMSPPSNVACAPVLLRVAPPDRRPDEVGVELVDRLHQQRLVVPGRPVQRVERHAAVEPAGGVARVERVGQRRHEVLAHAGRLAGQRDVAACGSRRAGRRWPARRSGTRRARAASSDSRNARVSSTRPEPDLVGDDLAVQQPVLGARACAIVSASRSCSSTTSTPRSRSLLTKSAWSRWAFSTHITSSNSRSSLLVGVSRRCARPGRAHQHLAQPADLGVDAVRRAGAVLTGHACLSRAGAAESSDRDPAGRRARRRRGPPRRPRRRG